jgi:hypothetical protein
MRAIAVLGSALLWSATGCGGSGGPSPATMAQAGQAGAGGEGGEAVVDLGPTPKVDTADPCVLNADCPHGQYCDLGECIQDCNVEQPCEDGAECSDRGRCLAPEEPEVESEPSIDFEGSVSADPTTVFLSPEQKLLRVKLTSTSNRPVRYRVQSSAPHLRLEQPRGEFEQETTLEFAVDPSALPDQDNSGSIRIVTSLGEQTVVAPIVPGLTGYYQGTMRYEAGPMVLGDTALGLDIIEQDGMLKVRVDPTVSLLFPEAVPAGDAQLPSSAATGVGIYAKADGLLDFTVFQRLPPKFGGTRNGFARPVLRAVRMRLTPGSLGTLEGQFTEDVSGIFTQSVRASGKLSLRYQTQRKPMDFTAVSATPVQESPTLGNYLAPRDVFEWTGNGGVYCAPVAAAGCDVLVDPAACKADIPGHAAALSEALVKPLYDDMAKPARSSAPFLSMADNCRAALNLRPTGQAASVVDYASFGSSSARQCGLIAPLGCLLEMVATGSGDAAAGGKVFSESVARLASPALLVAKEEISSAVEDSFTRGLNAERERYDAALTAMGATTRWLLQPEVLENLRTMPEEGAKGSGLPGSTTIVLDSYPAARALSEVFSTLALIDGERARLSAASEAAVQAGPARLTQERAVLAYLEAVTLGTLLEQWSAAPDSIAARFSGLLNPINRGYAALQASGGVFGVPAGFVPFVYRPEDVGKAGPTNFEQMLFLAQNSVDAEARAESDWLTAGRTFEENQQTLKNELDAVRQTFDLRLRQICGPSFNANQVDPAAWDICPPTGTGEVALRQNEVAQALEALRNTRSRVENKRDQVEISINAAARTAGLRKENINLVTEVGKRVAAIDMVVNISHAVVKGLEIAANAELWNAGAPLAMGVVATAFEVANAFAEDAKSNLRLIQTVRGEEISAKIEYLNAMAGVKRELLELQQLQVEVGEYVLKVVAAQIAQRTLLDEARALLEERVRALASSEKGPAADPSFRLFRDRTALDVLARRRDAQRQAMLVGRALEYELNASLGPLEGSVLNANSASDLRNLMSCYTSLHDAYRIAFGSPQEYVTTVSVRELLGIAGVRVDDVTGEELTEGRQFREFLLQNQNFDGNGSVGLKFATTLDPDNGLWSSDVCSDRIVSVQAQLVGDFLGDDEAQVNVSLGGTSLLRDCGSDDVQSWALGDGGGSDDSAVVAVLQAGVNGYGSAPANTSLFGQAVARATWKLTIPGPSAAPVNDDLDLTQIDDIVLKITHRAVARHASSAGLDLSCLQ